MLSLPFAFRVARKAMQPQGAKELSVGWTGWRFVDGGHAEGSGWPLAARPLCILGVMMATLPPDSYM